MGSPFEINKYLQCWDLSILGLVWTWNAMTDVLLEKRGWDFKHRDTEGKTMCSQRQIGAMQLQAKMWRAAGTCWKLGRRLEQIVPQGHQKKPMLSSPWFQISGLQHSERINVQCFKPSSLVIDYDSYRQLTGTEIFSSHFFSVLFNDCLPCMLLGRSLKSNGCLILLALQVI